MASISIQSDSKKTVLTKVVPRFIAGFVVIGAVIFIPAGTLKFFNAWLFIAGLFIPMMMVLIYFSIKDPELLGKRIRTKETEKQQKNIVRLGAPLYLLTYIIPGFDFRFGWSHVPDWVVAVSFIVMLGGYVMFVFVMLQNRYLSRVVEIQDNQKLIDTGLYSVVRHPMYLSASILYISSAFVLGSYYAVIPSLLLVGILAIRIVNEEEVLKKGLQGYDNYMNKVRYRLIPYIW